MARRLRTEIEIQASPDRVWEALTDFAAYPDWNPFIVQATGQPVPGSRLELQMRLPGRRPMAFRPEVLEAAPARRLRWLGRLLVPGLFAGDHTFALDPARPDQRPPPPPTGPPSSSRRSSAASSPPSSSPSSPSPPRRASTR